jgi:hypothetical protein
VYSILNLLAEFGGMTKIVMMLFGFILYPISEHSFILKASKMMFLARVIDGNLLRKSIARKPQKNLDHLSEKELKEREYHRIIRLKFMDSASLFIHHRISFLKCIMWRENQRISKIYNDTQHILHKELNIIKIIRSIRDIKILMKNSLMTPELK